MVRHTAFDKFSVVKRHNAGFNSLMRLAEEAGLIKIIKPGTTSQVKSRSKSTHPTKNVDHFTTRRVRAASAPARRMENPTVNTRSRGLKRGNHTDESDGPLVKKVKGAVRAVEKTRNSMVLRKRPRTFRARKMTKSTPQIKKVVPSKSKAVSKLARESISEADFKLDQMEWTPWRAAMAPRSTVPGSPTSWTSRREGPGIRNVKLFGNKTNVPAVYEFAVQPPGSRTRYPVQYKTTKGFTNCNWDTYMMSDWPTERQLDRVIRKGCKVYARRAVLTRPIKCAGTVMSSVDELKSLIGQTYDYAWREHYQVDTRRYVHRNVEKDGVKISDNPNWGRL